MKLTKKLILGEIIFFLLLMGGVFFAVFTFVLPEIRAIERQGHLKNLAKIEHAFQNELERIKIATIDWGEWDDTYEYVVKPSRDYEESNLLVDSIEDLKVDLLIILNRDHQVISKLHTEKMGSLERINLLKGQNWSHSHPLLQYFSDNDSAIFFTEKGPLLLARHPILTSQSTGPANGYLFFARLLDNEFTEHVSSSLELGFTASLVDKTTLQPSVEFINDDLSHAVGYQQLANSVDKVIQLDIEQPRPFYHQAMNATKISLLAVFIIGLMACFATYFMLKKILVNPIILLQKQAELFTKSEGKPAFSVLQRDDEIGALSTSFAEMAKELSNDFNRLEQERDELENASHTDALTNLKNRRYLEELMHSEDTWKAKGDWTIFTLDLDHFKKVNDSYGHDVGDVVLQQFSKVITQNFREQDIVVRSGGEEFTVICRQTDQQTANSIAERLRLATEMKTFGKDNNLRITCSIGFFTMNIMSAEAGLKYWQSMIKVSDLALYAAKHNGRNTWVGLNCLMGCEHGTYPKELPDIGTWIKERKLQLSSPKANPEEMIWSA
ncbi:diguanylate cyclase [Neptuniibacter caesariensis]|uniref:diguanylate cyclase n=1 Tax=Neptuniibacter caesariensis TaxID=207954 RepID=A0A7U8C5D9_NEPCE|nr:diguanylate cyclase [Neptuniibacter caesariensis]EAR61893.1 sensory box/GGDEF family protein [Oceanospirillum sp. MED92] [Neptuniibacter caesariensis]